VTAAAETFVVAATDDRRARAEELLAAQPEIRSDAWAALVLGEGWDGDRDAPGGPRGWPPVLYAAHSAFAPARLLGELLARGADPNAAFVNEHGAMSALYGAAGVVRDPAMTRVLLGAGASPDDGESLYHAAAAPDTTCLRLLLEHGARPAGTNALACALDGEALEPVRLLLEHGADPDEGALVAHAVRRGRGPDAIALLAAHGADIDRPGGETWRGDVPLRTPYQHAVLRGRDDVARTLAELGAATGVEPEDLALAAVARGERPPAPLPAALDPDGQEVVILAALRGHAGTVIDAFGPGFRGVVGGSPEGTLLHHAAWVGDPALVQRLLHAGADPVASSPAAFATPLAWAVLGSQHHALPGRDHAAVAEALAAAGNPVEPRFLDVAEGPVRDWLRSGRA
jgi:ankyrin repeat protein